ncbi:hypothetical protein JCM10213_008701 [Rhodosporidiobolus nylandii]
MLLLLPVELVERIVRLAVPQDYSSTTYPECQDTLRSLCLVCRDLFPLAQRILEEMVRVSRASTVETVEQLLQDEARRTRVRVLALERYQVEAAKTGCTGLRDVRLHLQQKADVSWLEELPGLRRLTISFSSLTTATLALPNLLELTWNSSTVPLPACHTFVSATSFSALRDLALWEKEETYEDRSPVADLPTFKHLQTYISGVVGSAANAKPVISAMAESCLQTGASSTFGYWLTNASHVRFFLITDLMSDDAFKSFFEGCIARLVGSDTPLITLSLLYLPTCFQPTDQQDPDLRSAVETFVSTCASRGITVDFEDTDESPGGSLTSPKFSRYARAKRTGTAAVE